MMRVLLFSPVRGETSCVKFRQNAETTDDSYNALVPASNTARLKKNGRHWSPGEGGFVVLEFGQAEKSEKNSSSEKKKKKEKRIGDTCNRDFNCTSLQMSIVSYRSSSIFFLRMHRRKKFRKERRGF